MKIIVDSREKKWDKIRRHFDEQGIKYEIKKLDIGDYQIEGHPEVTIDRKQNLSELSHNLTNRTDKSRFWKEIKRAKDTHTKMIILCEQGGNYQEISDVEQWHDKYTGVSGKSLMKYLYRLTIEYGVEVHFCEKRNTGLRIVQILNNNINGNKIGVDI